MFDKLLESKYIYIIFFYMKFVILKYIEYWWNVIMKVMLFGYFDNYMVDKNMKVIVVFNVFGLGFIERMFRYVWKD